MSRRRVRLLYSLLWLVACLAWPFDAVLALRVEPGVGAGVEYTDNVFLRNNAHEDTILAAYAGLDAKQDDGPFLADVSGGYNRYHYTQGRVDDVGYLQLNANVRWAMVKDRFTWRLTDFFNQTPIVANNANRSTNIQDANIFTLGADWVMPLSARNTLTFSPEIRRFYYEVLNTDNRQYGIAADWSYKMYHLTRVGLHASARKVAYEIAAISDPAFFTLQFNVAGQRPASNFTLHAGATEVHRDGKSFRGFSGDMSLQHELGAHGNLSLKLFSDLTESSDGRLNVIAGEVGGDFNSVQITTDVIRNRYARLGFDYRAQTLGVRLATEYREVIYSDSPLDRRIGLVDMGVDYAANARLKLGGYARYNKTRQTESLRTDIITEAGFSLVYRHSRKLRSLLDFKHREQDSTNASQSFVENAVFYSLSYGFGQVSRPSRIGGF